MDKLIVFPSFIAPTIRGVLGYSLKENNKDIFEVFFAKSEDGGKQKPYSISINEKQPLAYQPGDNFYFDITFFGDLVKQINFKTFIDFEKTLDWKKKW